MCASHEATSILFPGLFFEFTSRWAILKLTSFSNSRGVPNVHSYFKMHPSLSAQAFFQQWQQATLICSTLAHVTPLFFYKVDGEGARGQWRSKMRGRLCHHLGDSFSHVLSDMLDPRHEAVYFE